MRLERPSSKESLSSGRDGAVIRFCPECGEAVDAAAESRFCLECGADLAGRAGASSVEAAPVATCASCGAPIEEGSPQGLCSQCRTQLRRCPKCGSPLPSGAMSCASCGWTERRRIHPAVIAAVILAIAAAVVVAVLAATAANSHTASYTVYYQCEGADIADPKEVGGVEAGASVTERAKQIEGYEIGGDALSQTITVEEGAGNSITFEYEKKDSSSGFSSDAIIDVQAFLGTWYMDHGDASSLDAGNVADMWDFGLGSTLDVAEGGTGSLYLGGKSHGLAWAVSDGRLTAEIEGGSCVMQREGDFLVLSGYGKGDLYFAAASPERSHDGYVLADSSSKVYGADELEQLSRYELCLARNEIFIREGQASESAQIARRYRAVQADGGASAAQAVLSPIENANVMTISRVEWSQNTIYRNMLSTERRDCYLAYREKLADALGVSAAQLGGLAEDGRIALALLVDFDGTADTFEDLLVAFRSGSGYDVELWSYAEGSVSVEHSDSVSSLGSLVLVQRDGGCRLELGSGGISWGAAAGAVLSETEFDFSSQAASGSASSPRLAQDQLSVLAQETVKTLQADYCDDAPFYGVWLPAVDDVDDAWRDAVELQALGFDAWKVQPRWWSGLGGGEDDFMVTAGRFASEQEAESAAAELRGLGYANLVVGHSGDFEG